MKERSIPEAARRDKDSLEMLRVWIAGRGLHCSMRVGMYLESTQIEEETAWGILLADITRHVASALEQGYRRDEAEAVQRIQRSYLKELNRPTSAATGEFADKPKAP